VVSRFTVRIAGITVTASAEDPSLALRASEAAEAFRVADEEPDISIRVSRGACADPPRGKLIFDSGALWRVYQDGGGFLFRFSAPALGSSPYKEARFDGDFSSGEIRLAESVFDGRTAVDPLEYPLDELLFSALLGRGAGVELHGCGIVDADGTGRLFLGHSGAGKTTTARLWEHEEGVKILSDDRTIVRERRGEYWMFGTPWHGEGKHALAAGAPVSRVHFLRHGSRNERRLLSPTSAVEKLFACSFPPFYDARGLDFTLRFLAAFAAAVPCEELDFVPDRRVTAFLAGRAS
jgi:hypothetical protein